MEYTKDDIYQQVKDQIDIVDLVSEYVSLQKKKFEQLLRYLSFSSRENSFVQCFGDQADILLLRLPQRRRLCSVYPGHRTFGVEGSFGVFSQAFTH